MSAWLYLARCKDNTDCLLHMALECCELNSSLLRSELLSFDK
jgi:hypothetical protein